MTPAWPWLALLFASCGGSAPALDCEALQSQVELDLHGHNVNWRKAIAVVANGASSGCGRCFFYLGALLALGEPEVSQFARFRVSRDGGIEFQWASQFPESESLDRPLLAYYIGAEKKDAFSTLALSNYMLKGLMLGATRWWQGSANQISVPAINRIPNEPSGRSGNSLCPVVLRALEVVAETAASNEDKGSDVSALQFYIRNATEARRAKKELHDWMLARSRDGWGPAKYVQSALFLHGDEDLGVPRNTSHAAMLLDSVSQDGSADASWAALLVQARERNASGILRYAELVRDSDAPQLQKVMAQHYLHLYGSDRNASLAGVYLLAAADLGDPNAQQMVAHAYAGLNVPELSNIKIPGAPNEARALLYYGLAARQGRPVSAINAVSLLLRRNSDTSQSCRTAAATLQSVSLSFHPDVLSLHSDARWNFLESNEETALIQYVLLSELGSMSGHVNAADLWAKGKAEQWHFRCWRSAGLGIARECELDYRRRAAASGDVDAMLDVADAYLSSDETALAYQWASLASTSGSTRANFSVAYLKQHGVGTVQDVDGACKTYCSLLQLDTEPLLVRGMVYRSKSSLTRKSGSRFRPPPLKPKFRSF